MPWVKNKSIQSNWRSGAILPLEILYELEGPAIFTAQLGPSNFLFFKKAETEDGDLYLAAPIDQNELSALKSGQLSIRGCLSHREAWVFEVDYELNVIKYQEQTFEQYKNLLPPRGIALYAKYGEVPDTLEQADAFLSFKFESPSMSSNSMPLSVLKGLIDAVSGVARSALLPNALAFGRNSRFFDFDVAPVRFASLLIVIKDAQLNEAGLARSKETKNLSVPDLVSETQIRRNTFLELLDTVTNLARKGSLTNVDIDRNSEILNRIAEIIPSAENDLSRLQVSMKTSSGTKLISIDKTVGNRLHEMRQAIEAPIREIIGVITEVNEEARTFILKEANGRQITCNPLYDRYEYMKNRGLNIIGRRIQVKGKFWRRTRRDYLVLTENPTTPS